MTGSSAFRYCFVPSWRSLDCLLGIFSCLLSLASADLTNYIATQGVLGVPSLSLEDTDVPLGSYLAVGVARESACRSLAARAGDLAWTTGLVKESSWESLQALTGLASILTCASTRSLFRPFCLR